MTSDQAMATLRRLEYEVKSEFRQVKVTPSATVLAADTNKGKVYLKASTRREVSVTQCISSVEPKFARKPLYVDEEREWMLMEDYGESLDGRMNGRDFENLMNMFGGLQRKVESQIQRLIDGHVPRADPEKILRRVEKMLKDVFLSDDIDNALRSAKYPERIEKFDENAIQSHFECLKTLLKHLYEEQKIPLTLCHGDLGAYNIIKCGAEKDDYIFIDWGDACIDFPFDEVYCLRTHIASKEERDEASEDSYLQHWSEYGSPEELKDIRNCLHLKNLLVRFLSEYEYAVHKKVRPYLEENVLSKLCNVLKIMQEEVESPRQKI